VGSPRIPAAFESRLGNTKDGGGLKGLRELVARAFALEGLFF
jgi:hypothetical protein